MQIISLWFKITALLAVLGTVMHYTSPSLGPWISGFFAAKDVIDSAPSQPIPAAEAPQELVKEKSMAKPVYKFNE
jgi:hypothetical protein